MLDKNYERIYSETQDFTRADFVKRIRELEEINEEHRKLNAELNSKIKELEESNENNTI